MTHLATVAPAMAWRNGERSRDRLTSGEGFRKPAMKHTNALTLWNTNLNARSLSNWRSIISPQGARSK